VLASQGNLICSVGAGLPRDEAPRFVGISIGDGGAESPFRPYGGLLWQTPQSNTKVSPHQGPYAALRVPSLRCRYGALRATSCKQLYASQLRLRRRRCALAPPRHLHSALLVNGAGGSKSRSKADQDQGHNSLRSCCWWRATFCIESAVFLGAVALQIVGITQSSKSEANCALDLDLLPR